MNKKQQKLRKQIIKNIKQCRKRLWEISTEICSLDNDVYTYFSEALHKNIWKLQEDKIETDSEYDSDATVDLNIHLPRSESDTSFDSSFENENSEIEIVEN